jgi:hypothetical protein
MCRLSGRGEHSQMTFEQLNQRQVPVSGMFSEERIYDKLDRACLLPGGKPPANHGRYMNKYQRPSRNENPPLKLRAVTHQAKCSFQNVNNEDPEKKHSENDLSTTFLAEGRELKLTIRIAYHIIDHFWIVFSHVSISMMRSIHYTFS